MNKTNAKEWQGRACTILFTAARAAARTRHATVCRMAACRTHQAVACGTRWEVPWVLTRKSGNELDWIERLFGWRSGRKNLKERQAALGRTEAPNALVKPRRTGVSENAGPNVPGSDQICSSDYSEHLTKGGETAASFVARERRLAAKVVELEERESAVGAREAATFEADLRNEACERYLQEVAEAQEKAERALEERLQDATSQLKRLEEEAAEARRESVTARMEVEVVKREAGESIHRSEDRAGVRASEVDAVREESSALRTTVFQQIAAREAEVRQAQERIAEAERQRASAQTEARAASELLERLRSDFEERVQLAVAQEIQRSTEQRNGLGRPHRERHSNPPEVPVLDVSRHTRVPQITKARPSTPASTSSGFRGLPTSQTLLVSHDGADVRNESLGGCSDAQGESQASGSRFVERIQTLSPLQPSHVASEGTCFPQTQSLSNAALPRQPVQNALCGHVWRHVGVTAWERQACGQQWMVAWVTRRQRHPAIPRTWRSPWLRAFSVGWHPTSSEMWSSSVESFLMFFLGFSIKNLLMCKHMSHIHCI